MCPFAKAGCSTLLADSSESEEDVAAGDAPRNMSMRAAVWQACREHRGTTRVPIVIKIIQARGHVAIPVIPGTFIVKLTAPDAMS